MYFLMFKLDVLYYQFTNGLGSLSNQAIHLFHILIQLLVWEPTLRHSCESMTLNLMYVIMTF